LDGIECGNPDLPLYFQQTAMVDGKQGLGVGLVREHQEAGYQRCNEIHVPGQQAEKTITGLGYDLHSIGLGDYARWRHQCELHGGAHQAATVV